MHGFRWTGSNSDVPHGIVAELEALRNSLEHRKAPRLSLTPHQAGVPSNLGMNLVFLPCAPDDAPPRWRHPGSMETECLKSLEPPFACQGADSAGQPDPRPRALHALTPSLRKARSAATQNQEHHPVFDFLPSSFSFVFCLLVWDISVARVCRVGGVQGVAFCASQSPLLTSPWRALWVRDMPPGRGELFARPQPY